jgi:hypothetical protein
MQLYAKIDRLLAEGPIIKLGKGNPELVRAKNEILAAIGQETDVRDEVITPEGVRVDLSAFGGRSLRLSSIQSDGSRGIGSASRVLDKLVSLADQHQIPITLLAQPYGDAGLTKRQLISWYSKRGFKLQDDGETMIRLPSSLQKYKPE